MKANPRTSRYVHPTLLRDPVRRASFKTARMKTWAFAPFYASLSCCRCVARRHGWADGNFALRECRKAVARLCVLNILYGELLPRGRTMRGPLCTLRSRLPRSCAWRAPAFYVFRPARGPLILPLRSANDSGDLGVFRFVCASGTRGLRWFDIAISGILWILEFY